MQLRLREWYPGGLHRRRQAHAGERREDVGYAAWLWLDLGNSDLEPTFQARRLARFVEAYGGSALTDALPAVLDAQTELANRPGTPMGIREWAQTCQDWVKRNRLVLARIVNSGAKFAGMKSLQKLQSRPTSG